MNNFSDILKAKYKIESKAYYKGNIIETGGTAISTSTSPAVRYLVDNKLTKGQTVCDYGAGGGRNAKYLRDLGFKVYAYDPYNGSDDDGWKGVSARKPKDKFDVCFTCYVLNVVQEHKEKTIIASCKKIGKTTFHITRNMDIHETTKKAMARNDKLVMDFFVNEFGGNPKNYTDKDILDLCYFGVQTSKGFQRIPELENKGFKLLSPAKFGYKIYG